MGEENTCRSWCRCGKLKSAIDFAIASEATAPRDLKLNHYRSFGREPFGDAIGPLTERGGQTGLIIKNGSCHC